MIIPLIYQNDDMLVVNKPAGLAVFPEGNIKDTTLIDYLIEENPALQHAGEAPRYGIVHRLDRDTSGVLLIAKTSEALIFLQKKFINREVEKKYLALVTGRILEDSGEITTYLDRSKSNPRKQIITTTGDREAISFWNVIERFRDYTLLEVEIKTGRRHQIRCHLAHLHHPIAGDTLYGFKDSPCPKGLTRQFLHATSIKIQTPQGEIKTFTAPLPSDLQTIITHLEK